jgi:uncharacterized protein (TIGR03437 family)
LGEAPLAVTFIGDDVDGVRQVNATLPADLPKGELELRVECGDVVSPAVAVQVE